MDTAGIKREHIPSIVDATAQKGVIHGNAAGDRRVRQ